MLRTRPIHEQSGRSWRRWDTRSSWICSTLFRLVGNSTSYWSVWVVRHPFILNVQYMATSLFERKVVEREKGVNEEMKDLIGGRFSNASITANTCVLCFVTRRGIIHAARERRHLHGGHCLVRTPAVTAKCSTQSGKLNCFFVCFFKLKRYNDSLFHSSLISLLQFRSDKFASRISWTQFISVCA